MGGKTCPLFGFFLAKQIWKQFANRHGNKYGKNWKQKDRNKLDEKLCEETLSIQMWKQVQNRYWYTFENKSEDGIKLKTNMGTNWEQRDWIKLDEKTLLLCRETISKVFKCYCSFHGPHKCSNPFQLLISEM